VFALAHMMNFFSHEFAGLRRRGPPLPFVSSSSAAHSCFFGRHWLRHPFGGAPSAPHPPFSRTFRAREPPARPSLARNGGKSANRIEAPRTLRRPQHTGICTQRFDPERVFAFSAELLSEADAVALGLTLKLAVVTTAVLIATGTPLAWWLANSQSRHKAWMASVIALPLVLPPTVLGFCLLVLLGPNGPGGRLTVALGLGTLPFTFGGLVLASRTYATKAPTACSWV
jgi:ABC-type sugar transport system permease subunit